jgi:tungstate transport system substrate-binding protein
MKQPFRQSLGQSLEQSLGHPVQRRVKAVIAAAVAFMLAFTLAACGNTAKPAEDTATGDQGAATEKVEPKGSIRLATTTSTKDSGLLDAILGDFTAQTGYDVEVISVGSGEAMKLGENGEADVLLVHSPAAEKTFVQDGHADATGRLDVMYNDYVVIGPSTDPAGVKTSAATDATAAFAAIASATSPFISRGDESGTHKKELSIWEKAAIIPEGDWYVVAGDGMGAVITMADERQAYTLADRATWLAKSADVDLVILSEKDPSGLLNNQYGVICVDPGKNASINHDGAVAFQQWITSSATQSLIETFGLSEYGEALFTPNAVKR